MPHRALLLVDLQNDFCAGGALAYRKVTVRWRLLTALLTGASRAEKRLSPARTGIRRITAVLPVSTV